MIFTGFLWTAYIWVGLTIRNVYQVPKIIRNRHLVGLSMTGNPRSSLHIILILSASEMVPR